MAYTIYLRPWITSVLPPFMISLLQWIAYACTVRNTHTMLHGVGRRATHTAGSPWQQPCVGGLPALA